MTYKELLEKSPQFLDWDLELRGKPYQVVKYNGWNTEDYVCYEIDKDCNRVKDYYIPKNENLELVNCYGVRGEAPTWEIKQNKDKYTKTKWGDTSLRFHCNTVIYRNGIPFFQFSGSEEYTYHKAKSYLIEVLDGPVNFHSRFWRDELVGKKIRYNGEPAIIERVNTNMFSMWIVPVNGKFKPPHRWDTDDKDQVLNREYWNEEYASGLVVENVLDSSINWFPKD